MANGTPSSGTNRAVSGKRLELMAGDQARRTELVRGAQQKLAEFRASPNYSTLSTRDVEELLLRPNSGSNAKNHNYRAELIYMLSQDTGLSLRQLCVAIGMPSNTLVKLRRKDPEIDQAVNDYMTAFFENECMTGESGIHPALTIFGLKAKAGWMDAKDNAITLQQLNAMAENIINVVRDVVRDPTLIAEIERRLSAPVDAIQVAVEVSEEPQTLA